MFMSHQTAGISFKNRQNARSSPIMSAILEEKLREAASKGDIEAVMELVAQNVDVNSRNGVNGWTALHWAAKRGNDTIASHLLRHGASATIENNEGETPGQVCTDPFLAGLLGVNHPVKKEPKNAGLTFTPNYLRNPPINNHVDVGKIRAKHADFSSMKTTTLPSGQTDEVVLSVRVAGSSDPDFIEIEIPRWRLTYANLMQICCEELNVFEVQVERIRKLPNTRLRKDGDVGRLVDFQCLELVLKMTENTDNNAKNRYESISTKDQQILY